MRLYRFEHCSLCFRVRMMAALKRLHLQETVVLYDDSETMVGLVGKRQIPILVKDDGESMLESMDMVKYVESHGDPVLVGPERNEITEWTNKVVSKTAPLTMPRYPLLGLPELATVAAFANPAVTIARSLSDTFAGIAPAGVIAFISAQLVGMLAAVMLSGWLWRR